ncbi:MAG: terminase small subunit [Candidatus Omnitrophica bacterium]|nr:terminase small subunit [Candidatus Omnitrophota bacterium]
MKSKELENKKHEVFCRELVKNKFNATKAYRETYPDSGLAAARTSASELLTNPNIKGRVLEILNTSQETNLEVIIASFSDDLNAVKPIITSKDKNIEFVRDNSTILEAKKTLLKMYGALGDKFGALTDNRSVTFNLSVEKVNDLQEAIKDLKSLTGGENE